MKLTRTIKNAEGVDVEDQIEITYAVPSGKARVEYAKLMEQMPESVKKNKVLEIMMAKAGDLTKAGENESVAIGLIQEAIKSGDINISEITDGFVESADYITKRDDVIARMFQVAVNKQKLPVEWQALIESKDFILEQNYAEVETFVVTFRGQLGLG